MPATWNINGTLATATVGEYQITVDSSQPSRGVQWSSAIANRLQCCTLQFKPPRSAQGAPVLADLYVRGSDLVATYDQLPGAEVQPQLYWRLMEQAELNAIGVQLLISMQTSLLQSEPRCTVESPLPGVRTAIWNWKEKAWWGTETGKDFDLVSQPSSRGFVTWFSAPKETNSYIEVIYPDDQVSQHVTLGHSEACFFAEHLEKGVIRRGRIAGWLASNQKLMDGPTTPLQLFQVAQQEALPLTT